MRVFLYTFYKWLYTTVYRITPYRHPCILFIYQVVINRYKCVYVTSVHYHMHKACDTTSHHEVIRSCEQLHGHVDLARSTLLMAKNPQFHQRSKHIDIKYHWIREEIATKNISLESCRDPDQTADILTKSLPCPKHQKHVYEMGLKQILFIMMDNIQYKMMVAFLPAVSFYPIGFLTSRRF